MPYKNKTCGVYVITNKETGEQYVGSTTNLEARWPKHKYDAKRGTSSPVHRAIRQYGEEAFSYEWLETCSKRKLERREAYWTGYLDTSYPHGYNVGSFQGTPTKEMLSKFPRGGIIEIGPHLAQRTISERKKNKAYREQFVKNKKIAMAKRQETIEKRKQEDPRYEERLRKSRSDGVKKWWRKRKCPSS